MIQLTRPVLIAGVAGLVAICAIAVAAWRLYLSGEGPAPLIATRSEPREPAVAPPAATPPVGAAPASSSTPPAATPPVGAAPASSSTPLAASPPAVAPPATPSAPPASAQVASSAPSPASPVPPFPAAPETKPADAGPAAPAVPAGAPPAAAVAASPDSVAAAASKPVAGAAPLRPSFDVVRIEPSGEAVVAGRAEPRARVALTLAGKPLAQAQADADGQFVMLPPRLPPGDHVLGLRATGPNGETTSEQTVAVAVPARGDREPVVALAAPDKPTVVLSQPGGERDAPGGRDLRITSIEAQQGGAFFASGAAPAGSSLRLYLNESYVASVEAGADGKWSVRVERGMSPGAYRVRADRLGGDGKVLARVEAPFDYPADLARQVAAASREPAAPPQPASPATFAPGAQEPGSAPPAAALPGAPAGRDAGQPAAVRAGDPQNAVVEELRTARVERGDSLWRISRSIYGEGIRYTQIYDANASQIRNPDLIYPGQVLVVPKQDEGKPAGGGERKR